MSIGTRAETPSDGDGPGIVLHQVGPRHAVTDYLRRIGPWSIRGISDEDRWMNALIELSKAKRIADPASSIERALRGTTGGEAVLDLTTRTGRSLGRPTTTVCAMRAARMRMEAIGADDSQTTRAEEWLMVGGDEVEARHDRIEVRINPIGFAFVRHALERVHEREHCPTGGIDDEMRQRVVRMRLRLSFVMAAGLLRLGIPAGPGFRPIATMVPFGDGLAIAERHIVAMRPGLSGGATRITVRGGRARLRSEAHNPLVVETVEAGDGRSLHLHHVWVVRTHISDDIMRPAQRRYRDLFERALSSCDAPRLDNLIWGRDMQARKDMGGYDLDIHDDAACDELRSILADQMPTPERDAEMWVMDPTCVDTAGYLDDGSKPARPVTRPVPFHMR